MEFVINFFNDYDHIMAIGGFTSLVLIFIIIMIPSEWPR